MLRAVLTKTSLISLSSIHRVVFLREAQLFLCDVRAKSMYILCICTSCQRNRETDVLDLCTLCSDVRYTVLLRRIILVPNLGSYWGVFKQTGINPVNLRQLQCNEVFFWCDVMYFMSVFPCIITLYYIKNQLDADLAVLFISHCKITLHVSDAFCVHHQDY